MCPHACDPQRFRKSLQRPLRVGDEGLRCLLADPKIFEEGRGCIVHHRTHMKSTAPIEASPLPFRPAMRRRCRHALTRCHMC